MVETGDDESMTMTSNCMVFGMAVRRMGKLADASSEGDVHHHIPKGPINKWRSSG